MWPLRFCWVINFTLQLFDAVSLIHPPFPDTSSFLKCAETVNAKAALFMWNFASAYNNGSVNCGFYCLFSNNNLIHCLWNQHMVTCILFVLFAPPPTCDMACLL